MADHTKYPDVGTMDYSTFVGFMQERNRPSGGLATVQEAAVQARLAASSSVLEIGSNTGFTSVNLALLTGAQVVGIDVNADSVAEAGRLAKVHQLSERVEFRIADGRRLPFEDKTFDAVWVSNVLSFVAEKADMLSDAVRVLKPGGTLIVVPIYYRDTPPQQIVDKVSDAIGTTVDVLSKSDWRTFVEREEELELYYQSDHAYLLRSAADIDAYCDVLMEKEHLRALPDDVAGQVRDRVRYFMSLFNENLHYAGFSVLLYQRRAQREEMELFVSRPVELQH